MRNPNASLPNRNSLYLGKSGSGKSQALKQNPMIPKRGARVALWDPNNDHECRGYDSIGDFVRALGQADIASKQGGRGFRVGYQGPDSMDAFLIWCQAVTAILDGNYFTHLIAEELSTVSPSAGKAPPPAAKLLNQCRKYGGIFHGTSQKAQEISKTYYDQCEHLWVGRQKTVRQSKIVSEEIGIEAHKLRELPPLTFYYDDGGDNVRLIKLSYQG